jgi:arsenate reductase
MLRERGVEFDAIEYLKQPLDRSALEQLLRILDAPAAELVRKDKRFAELGLRPEGYQTAEQVTALLLEHPELMQRPIAVRGERAIIARPGERVLEMVS